MPDKLSYSFSEAETQERFARAIASCDLTEIKVCERYIASGFIDVDMPDAATGRTYLHNEAAQGHLAVVRELVESCGARVDVKDNDGKTPLDLADMSGHEQVKKFLEEEIEKLGKFAVAHKCSSSAAKQAS